MSSSNITNYPPIINFSSNLDELDLSIIQLMNDIKNNTNEQKYEKFYLEMQQFCENLSLTTVNKYYNQAKSNTSDYNLDQFNFSCHALSNLLIIRFILLQIAYYDPNSAMYWHKYGKTFSACFAHIISANLAELVYEYTKLLPFSSIAATITQRISLFILLVLYNFICDILALVTSSSLYQKILVEVLYVYIFNLPVIVSMFTIRFMILFNNILFYLFFGRRNPIYWADFIIGDLGTHLIRFIFTATTNSHIQQVTFEWIQKSFALEITNQHEIFLKN
jgi:hypothetical protein